MMGLLLASLDGSNPLAFLAALGTLRVAHLSDSAASVMMSWERISGCWRPRLHGFGDDEQAVCAKLMQAHWSPVGTFESIGKNLTVPADVFTRFAESAHDAATLQDRRAADFAAAFGCETCVDAEKGRIEYTDLCFITGSGHQDFLGTMVSLARNVTQEHLHDALFGRWRMEKGLSMRWDPSDAAEYALQWNDPGPKGAWAVWGANRLASEAIPLFPSMPTDAGLVTTGFRRRLKQDEFTWPIWSACIGLDTVRSMLACGELQNDSPDRCRLRAMGIEEIYRAKRVRIGQGANFKISFRQARAV
jgi:hypothetical protein